ncbi:hypothetical protein L7F22_007469 [Adiantum nelumboides]|nr:hypothetical protein [Adiantum nelumboides]
MATRGFGRLRTLWTTCQCEWLRQARPFSSSQTIPFSAQWRVFSPQVWTPSANLKAFSAQAGSNEPASSAEGEAVVKKKRRRRKKTFLEVAQFLPNWGLNARFTKSHWPEGNFYKVTKVKVYKSGRQGAAWGVFHQNEAAKTGEVQKIGGVNKRCWRYVPDVDLSALKYTGSYRLVKEICRAKGLGLYMCMA